MAYDILEAARINTQADRSYRLHLEDAVRPKNHSWVKKPIPVTVGIIGEIGRSVIVAIPDWLLLRPSSK